MAMDRLESRFVERLQFEVGDAEVAQELSIPRKPRRLDVVCRFREAPVMFDALRADCSRRTVVFEHVSASLQGGKRRPDSPPCSATPTFL
jgi:hypothetical protein